MKKVLILLANGVEPLELSALTDVLGWANLAGSEEIETHCVGLRREINTTFGLTLAPKLVLSEANLTEYDALAIPGGFEPSGFYEEALSEDFLDVIRHFHDRNCLVASVCVASICLGAAGVLAGRQATTYHQIGGARKAQLEATGAVFVDRPIVVDGNIITSSGPGTAVEVALGLLGKLTTAENAEFIREKMRIPLPSELWYERPQVDHGAV